MVNWPEHQRVEAVSDEFGEGLHAPVRWSRERLAGQIADRK